MFTRPDQLERKGGSEERLSFLQKLKDEYSTTKSLEAKQQVFANLANFAYDPINYPFIKQLQIVNLFVTQLQHPESEELCSYAVGGLCNLSCDPQLASQIISSGAVTHLLGLLNHKNIHILLNTLTTLYYLAGNEPLGYQLKTPQIYHKLITLRESDLQYSEGDLRLSNLLTILLDDIWGNALVEQTETKHTDPVEVIPLPDVIN